MSAPRAFRLALLILAAPLLAAAQSDDVREMLEKAKKAAAATATPTAATPASAKRSCTDGIAASPGKFCESVKDCKKFCSCACSFDPHKWKADVKNDGSTTCPDAPKTGPGMLAPDSPELARLADAGFSYITFDPGERAAAVALDGLRRLDAHLAASPDRAKYGYTVRVVSCYRPQIDDTEAECGFTLKSMYMLDRISDPKQRGYWDEKANPNNLGLAWPGKTPHSGGYACDLVLVDRNGRDSFDSRAGVDGAPRSSIDQRLASRLLDEEVTNPDVGGSRLTFEAWHYEWTTVTNSRCKAPDCAERHWPVTGKP
jgi:hypothetical protein